MYVVSAQVAPQRACFTMLVKTHTHNNLKQPSNMYDKPHKCTNGGRVAFWKCTKKCAVQSPLLGGYAGRPGLKVPTGDDPSPLGTFPYGVTWGF